MRAKKALLAAIDEVPSQVWEEIREHYEVVFVRDGHAAEQQLHTQSFDVIFLDIFLSGRDGLQLLRSIDTDGTTPAVILTSEAPNFQFAREGLLCGACDYLLRPLGAQELKDCLHRIEQRQSQQSGALEKQQRDIAACVGTPQFSEQLAHSLREIRSADSIQADRRCHTLYRHVVGQVFAEHPWLNRFLSAEECAHIDEIHYGEEHMVENSCLRQGSKLNESIRTLYPETQDSTVRDILRYMLEHVDSLGSQKEIAQLFFFSPSAFSERFSRALGCSYRSYCQRIRLYRAAYLLRHTEDKLYEICETLGFRDPNYFSKQFRQQMGVSATDYRCENAWDFTI